MSKTKHSVISAKFTSKDYYRVIEAMKKAHIPGPYRIMVAPIDKD